MKALVVRYFKSKLSFIIATLLLIPIIGQWFWNPNTLVSNILLVILIPHATLIVIGWWNYKHEKISKE